MSMTVAHQGLSQLTPRMLGALSNRGLANIVTYPDSLLVHSTAGDAIDQASLGQEVLTQARSLGQKRPLCDLTLPKPAPLFASAETEAQPLGPPRFRAVRKPGKHRAKPMDHGART